jgi:glycine dehydrogenase subunit 1
MNEVIYPYIPNTAPESRKAMLAAIGVKDADELYREIPEHLRFKGRLDLPEPFLSEYDLEKHVRGLLAKDITCNEYLNFLGAGCEQHHVPAAVDSVISRGEFLTAYLGNAYTDNGRWQALFEYQSLLCDLLGMEIAGMPMTCGLAASGSAVRMAARITGRSEVLVPATMNPRRLVQMKTYCRKSEVATITQVAYDAETGLLDMHDLEDKLHAGVACVLVENPSYLGVIESQIAAIADLAHAAGALLVACVNPISLGVLPSPGDYGADIACGDSQPLGVHMNYGGGATGFVATMDIPEHIAEFSSLMVNITPTVEGDGFGFTFWGYAERLHYMARELGKEYTGTNAALWAIANAVYLSLMGPEGMREIGETIVAKSHYAKKVLAEIPGVKTPFSAPHFNEFVVNFDGTGKSVAQIDEALRERRIFGGANVGQDFPGLGESALFCISEIHTADDLKTLADALKEVTR